MQELAKQIGELDTAVVNAMRTLSIDELAGQLEELKAKSSQADFWSDTSQAQEVMKQQARLEQRVSPWQELNRNLTDLKELVSLDDSSLQADLQKQFDHARGRFNELKEELKYGGRYDDHDVILSFYAGAGGTDAQDWTQILFRMYVRWAENHKYTIKVIDESAGEEAGLKSATIEIEAAPNGPGAFAYGRLKGEHGVHRLVRLSPFNSDHLRQTSFAKIEVLPKVDKPDDIVIDDKDLKVDVYRSGGHGGQSVNTTDSAVRLTHLPTGLSVAIQNERSQLQNKETAMTILRSKLAQLRLEQHSEKLTELKGPNQAAEWGNQIRSYVLHPYKQAKDLRTKFETSDVDGVLDGNLDPFIDAYLEHNPEG